MRVRLGTVVNGQVVLPENIPVPEGTRVMVFAPEPGDEKIQIPSPCEQMMLLEGIDQLRRGVRIEFLEGEEED
jgi:hypothetical protein